MNYDADTMSKIVKTATCNRGLRPGKKDEPGRKKT